MTKIEDIIKIKENQSQWYDMGLRTTVDGKQIEFSYADNNLGKWKFLVRADEINCRVNISPHWSEKTDLIANGLHRKSILFQKSELSGAYYVPVGINYIDDGKIRRKYVKENSDIPKILLKHFNVDTNANMKRAHEGKTSNRLVIACEKDEYEKMVLAFITMQIIPIFT